MNFVQQNIA
jgi:hypothetical protein